jgi:predicted site-specific integrase-resolvase
VTSNDQRARLQRQIWQIANAVISLQAKDDAVVRELEA